VRGFVRRDDVFYTSRSQFIPNSSWIFRPTGKQIFIRYQSSVSLSRFFCRIDIGKEENEERREKEEEIELSDKPRAITRRQRRRADIYGLRIWYILCVTTSRLDVRTCARFTHTDLRHSLSLSLSLFTIPFLPTLAKERIWGVMRRRPSLDILPSSPVVRSSFLPSSVLAVTSVRTPRLPTGKRGRTAESFRHNIFYRWEPYIITVSDENRALLSASNRPSYRDPFIPDSTGFYHGPPLCACLRSCLAVFLRHMVRWTSLLFLFLKLDILTEFIEGT